MTSMMKSAGCFAYTAALALGWVQKYQGVSMNPDTRLVIRIRLLIGEPEHETLLDVHPVFSLVHNDALG